MSYEEITVYQCHCNLCRHNWTTRILKIPDQCPKCHNPRWNKEKHAGKQPRLGITI